MNGKIFLKNFVRFSSLRPNFCVERG